MCLGSQEGLFGEDPKVLYASAKAPPSCLAREDTGGGGRELSSSHAADLHKESFRVIGWQNSSWAFFSACAQNTNQAVSLGCHTN